MLAGAAKTFGPERMRQLVALAQADDYANLPEEDIEAMKLVLEDYNNEKSRSRNYSTKTQAQDVRSTCKRVDQEVRLFSLLSSFVHSLQALRARTP